MLQEIYGTVMICQEAEFVNEQNIYLRYKKNSMNAAISEFIEDYLCSAFGKNSLLRNGFCFGLTIT